MEEIVENVEQKNKTLQEINDEKAKVLLPVLVLYVSIMSIGIIGNAVVIVIYTCRFKLSPRKIFILTLALLDLTTCSVGLPYHVLDILEPYTYKYLVFCKISTATILFVYVSSISILIIIGVDRYLKICHPFQTQITTRGAKYTCGILIFASLVMAFPIFELYGYSKVKTGYGNITGVECFFSEEYNKNNSFPLTYHVILLTIFVAATIVLLALYSLICRELYITRRRLSLDKEKMNSHKSNSEENIMEANTCMLSSVPSKGQCREAASNFEGKNTISKFPINEIIKSPVMETSGCRCHSDLHENEEACGDSNYESTKFDLINEEVKAKEKMKTISIQVLKSKDRCYGGRCYRFRFISWILRCKTRINKMQHGKSERRRAIMRVLKDKRTLKTTYTMLTITALFILSYLPTFYVTIHGLMDPDLWNRTSDDKMVLYHILLRSYLINNMMNPIVYGFIDEKFRQECFRMPLQCRRRR
ncbi:hypothetical protein CHS0354_027012 [Potamilus streckersoni]|uniref:G-protein coupled receptors family 1 profile domain-containing protein n=1 Tax=Potamilus streckersoni TaxID=2493646 RepID=A0AAE0SQV9_9BIVA|nr:hypothetical protein CHS0354_027012 [Potamilus streckersoni]